MVRLPSSPAWSLHRARLASFDHAYAVAVQRKTHGGRDQFILATGDALQPYRITSRRPSDGDTVLAVIR